MMHPNEPLKAPSSPPTTVIVALGFRMHALERIAKVGRFLGVGSRSSAYRLSETDSWPLVGPASSQWVLTIPLLERYGIPYSIDGMSEPEVPACDGIENRLVETAAPSFARGDGA